MAIGTAGEISVYVRRQGHEVGTNTLTNYTDYLLSFVLNKRLNRLSSFEATFISIDTSDEKTDFTAGSAIYIMAGQVLVDKVVMEQPKFNTDGTVNVVATSSTGVEDLPRRLATEFISRDYIGVGSDDIVDNTGSDPRGIAIEDDDTAICDTDVTASTGEVSSLHFAGTPRMVAISQLCNASDQEWYFNYGTNDATPYSEGDVLHIVTRTGNASSQYTFDLYDQTDSNALEVVNNTENASIVNDVELYSVDNTNTQIKTNIYHASLDRTTVNGDIDSWLAADIDKTTTTVTVVNAADFADDDTILIGNEQMTVDSGGGTTSLVVTRGDDLYHKKGQDVIRLTDTGSGDTTIDISVASTSGFSASGSIYVGSELMTYTGLGAGTFTGCTRTSTLSYSHGDNAPVYDIDTKDSPEASSSISDYGIHSRSLDRVQISSKNDLDIQGERIISNFKDPVQRITVNAADPLDVLETNTVEIGDRITINNSSLEDITDGDYRVIAFDFTYDVGQFGLILYCINDDMRVIDISDYLMHTEKLMAHVDAGKQSSDYLGGQNIDPVYSDGGGNLILNPSGDLSVRAAGLIHMDNDNHISLTAGGTPYGVNLSGHTNTEACTTHVLTFSGHTAAEYFTVETDTNADVLSANGAGVVTIGDGATNYTFPTVRGTNTQILQSNASGGLEWAASGGASDNWTDTGGNLEPNDDGDSITLKNEAGDASATFHYTEANLLDIGTTSGDIVLDPTEDFSVTSGGGIYLFLNGAKDCVVELGELDDSSSFIVEDSDNANKLEIDGAGLFTITSTNIDITLGSDDGSHTFDIKNLTGNDVFIITSLGDTALKYGADLLIYDSDNSNHGYILHEGHNLKMGVNEANDTIELNTTAGTGDMNFYCGSDINLILGDKVAGNKVYFQDSDSISLGSVDSNGKAWFQNLAIGATNVYNSAFRIYSEYSTNGVEKIAIKNTNTGGNAIAEFNAIGDGGLIAKVGASGSNYDEGVRAAYFVGYGTGTDLNRVVYGTQGETALIEFIQNDIGVVWISEAGFVGIGAEPSTDIRFHIRDANAGDIVSGLVQNTSNTGNAVSEWAALDQSGGVEMTCGVTGTNHSTDADTAYFLGNGEGLANVVLGSEAGTTVELWSGGNMAMTIATDLGITVGSPTGGSKGAGTLNAVGLYDDGTLVADFVFEDGYDLKTIEETESFYTKNKHLPTIIGREDFEKKNASMGQLINQLWETIEVQAIHISELNNRLKKMEEK